MTETSSPAFTPRRWLGNGHAMTIFAWGRARTFPALPVHEERLIRVADDTQVRARCYWQPDRSSRPTLLAMHGLEGSSEAHYMLGLADKAWRRGWNAVLLNQRNCGGTEHLSPGLYHSGLTADQHAVLKELSTVDQLSRIGIVGYSLGGNLTMKLAAEFGGHADPVKAVVAVSPTIDLERCVRAIERRVNYAYQWNFVRNLRARMRRKAAAWPAAFDVTPLDSIWTIRKFDDVYTAPFHGFGDASNYYQQASAIQVISQIRIPALILSAADDPFVPPEQFSSPAVRGNPNINVRIEPHGGHCGFVGEANGSDDGYWAESTAVAFLARVMGG